MKNLLGLAVLAFAFLLVADVEPAQAQYLGGTSNSFGLGLGYLGSPYASGRVPTPPYFALHPPVYYSQPVARTYGYSPFAYPGTVKTPEAPVAAKVINNPHVTTPVKKKVAPKGLDLTIRQVEVLNPFVTPTKTKMVSAE